MHVDIELDLTAPEQKYLKVKYTVSELTEPELVLTYPTWSPGSYLIREYSCNVEAFAAADSKGNKLTHEKISKNQWRIDAKKSGKVIITYKVYASELNVRAVYADHELVFINPTAAFFYPETGIHGAVNLKIKAPAGWSVELAHKAHHGVHSFNNFDHFYDTPILCAKDLQKAEFKQGATNYRIALWGRHTGDIKKIAADVKKIVAKEMAVFNGNPCPEYLFQIILAEKQYGGLEHSFSSTNIFDGMLFENEKDYKKFLALLAHEHFHLWNVKRIRPVELGPFDYQRENYTRDLWMAEGITSYYDDHFVLRAGLITNNEYLALLADNLTKLESGKAAKVNSISDSSFDAWIRFYRQNENSLNTITSYYLKGGLVVMLMDFKIIKATNGRKNMDDVMRELNQIYEARPEKGITRQEFLNVLEKISKVSFHDFFADFIDGVKPIDWQEAFKPFGIEVKKTTKKGNGFFGIVLSEQSGRVTIQNVSEDSPAYKSILQSGDELIALNHDRISAAKQLEHYLKKSKVHVIFSRRGKVLETTVTLTPKAIPSFGLSLKKRPRPLEKKNLRSFLRK